MIIGVRDAWLQGGTFAWFSVPKPGEVILRANDNDTSNNSRGWSVTLYHISDEPITKYKSWINYLYIDLLGRVPSEEEKAQKIGNLESGAGFAGMVDIFLFSKEFAKIVVNNLYKQLLDRYGDSEGVRIFVNRLNHY